MRKILGIVCLFRIFFLKSGHDWDTPEKDEMTCKRCGRFYDASYNFNQRQR